MKTKLLFTLLLFGPIISAQNCDFTPTKQLGFLNAVYSEIEEAEFTKVELSKAIVTIQKKTEQEFIEKYPSVFKRIDSCYTLKSKLKNDKEGLRKDFKICKNTVQSKAYSNFAFMGVFAGNALITYQLNEDGGYYLVNLNTGFTSVSLGKPISYDGKTAISFENNYGEEELALTDLKTNRQFILRINNWRTIQSKFDGKSYYLKLQPFEKNSCGEEFKYFKIELEDQ